MRGDAREKMPTGINNTGLHDTMLRQNHFLRYHNHFNQGALQGDDTRERHEHTRGGLVRLSIFWRFHKWTTVTLKRGLLLFSARDILIRLG